MSFRRSVGQVLVLTNRTFLLSLIFFQLQQQFVRIALLFARQHGGREEAGHREAVGRRGKKNYSAWAAPWAR